jgi:hypothetical protein
MRVNLLRLLRPLKLILDPVLSIALIVGVVIALWQLFDIVHQTKLQSDTLRLTQQVESARLAFKFRDRIENSRFSSLVAAIQNHSGNFHLLASADGGNGGAFRDIDIEDYLGNFEDMGYLVGDNLIFSQMAYRSFSYDIEKAWCNADVQRVIRQARQADKSVAAISDPMFGSFEKLAFEYLAREKQSCKDLDRQ